MPEWHGHPVAKGFNPTQQLKVQRRALHRCHASSIRCHELTYCASEILVASRARLKAEEAGFAIYLPPAEPLVIELLGS